MSNIIDSSNSVFASSLEVYRAINSSYRYIRDYFESTCRQRLADGVGSHYEGINTVEEMVDALNVAVWVRSGHPDVPPACKAYKTRDIKGGRFGMVKISELPEDTVITASDPKHTGMVSMIVKGQAGPRVEETWLIVGPEEVDGATRDVVYTFHPGEPVRPSTVEVSACPDGTRLSKARALALGFDLAKVS